MKKLILLTRQVTAISLILFSLTGFIPLAEYTKSSPLDVSGIVIVASFMIFLFITAYILYPKKKYVEDFIQKVFNATPIQNIQKSNPLLETFKSEDDKVNNSIDDRIDKNTLVENNLKHSSTPKVEVNTNSSKSSRDKYTVINPIIVGTLLKERQQALNELIDTLKDNDFFYELYEGMTDNEIINDYLTRDEDYPVWELTEELLPFATIIPDSPNADGDIPIAVYVGTSEENTFKVASILDRDAERMRDLISNGELVDVVAVIKGGKNKIVDYNHCGQEQVRTRKTLYMLDLKVLFLK